MAEPLGHQNLLHIRLLVNGSYLRTSQSSPPRSLLVSCRLVQVLGVIYSDLQRPATHSVGTIGPIPLQGSHAVCVPCHPWFGFHIKQWMFHVWVQAGLGVQLNSAHLLIDSNHILWCS